jgi:hypothetical protein
VAVRKVKLPVMMRKAVTVIGVGHGGASSGQPRFAGMVLGRSALLSRPCPWLA